MRFPEKLRYLMRLNALTQTSLGELLEVSHRAVGKWLAGDTMPHPVVARRIADHFGFRVEELLDDSDWPNASPAGETLSAAAVSLIHQHLQKIDQAYATITAEMEVIRESREFITKILPPHIPDEGFRL
jgi:transcriptional regulator with XRE-family HTH domain